MTSQDLKNAILQLAVQGKLVPQDPNDEPASELLKRIKAEKERLVKDGKIKKEKSLVPIANDEIPFDIPGSWEWIRLGDFCSVYNGDSINADEKQAKYSKKCDGHCYIGTKDVGFDNSVNYDNGIYIPLSDTNFKIAYADSVLMCMEGGSAGRKIAIIDKDVCFGNKLCCFSPIVISNKYLFSFLQSKAFFAQFTALMTGIIGGVGAQKLKSITIPLPPLAEQQRIVAKIEELMPLVEEYGKAEERLTALNAEFPDKLRKSILQQAIQGKLTERDPADEPASELLKRIRAEKERLIKEGKIKKEKPLPSITEEEVPFEIPENWEWVRFAEIINYMSTGPFGSMLHKSDYVSNGIPLVNPANIVSSRIVPSERMMVSRETAERLSSYKLQSGYIVMGRRGEMGRCAIVTDAENGWICGTGSFFMEPSKSVFSEFIILFFATAYAKQYLGGESVGSTMNNLNHTILNRMPIPLPPLAEQQRIVDRVNELLAVCDELK